METNFDKRYEYLAGKEVEFFYISGQKTSGFVVGIKNSKGITIKDFKGKNIFCLNKNKMPTWIKETYEEVFIYALNCIEGGIIGNFIDIYLGDDYDVPSGKIVPCPFEGEA